MGSILRLGGGLLLLIISNIAIGSIQAAAAREWNTKTFLNGLIKGGIVIGAFVAVWFAGWLNPDLVVIETGGQQMNLSTAFYFILVMGFVCYAGKILVKLKEIVTTKSAINSNSPAPSEEKPEEGTDDAEGRASAVEEKSSNNEEVIQGG